MDEGREGPKGHDMTRIAVRGPRGLLQRLIFFFSRRMFGRIPSSVAVWARSRRVFNGSTMMELALQKTGVPTRAHALADLAAARQIGCRYCLDIGSWVGIQKGLREQDLAGLDDFERAPCFSEAERAAIAFAEAMTQTPPAVDDALFARISAHYDQAQIVELAAIVGWEQYRARINHALGLVPEGFLDSCPIAPAHPKLAATG